MSAAEFQVMPRLTADEYAELEASIVEHGVQVPIVLSRDDRIVDGYHRDEIARKHSLHCPRVYADGDETELRGLAFSLNLHRRHLNRDQKRQLVAESIKADPQLSNREHGRRTGVSKNTAAAVRGELEESGQVDHFSERIDPRTGNASQPVSKPPRPEAAADRLCRDCDGNGCETCFPVDGPATDEQMAEMADMSDEEFESALAAARADGDLSAGDVIRNGQLGEDRHLSAGNPILALRDRLDRISTQGFKSTDRDTIGLFVLAWNAWRNDRKLTKFQRPAGGSWTRDTFPEAV